MIKCCVQYNCGGSVDYMNVAYESGRMVLYPVNSLPKTVKEFLLNCSNV